MGEMFWGAEKFNQPLNNWDVSNVTYMDSMFDSSGMSESNATWYFVDGDSDSTVKRVCVAAPCSIKSLL